MATGGLRGYEDDELLSQFQQLSVRTSGR